MQMTLMMIETSGRRIPECCRRNVVHSHVDLRRFLQTIIAGFIFFVANIKAGQQGHSISVSGAASGVILDGTVGHKSAVECHKIIQSNNSCSNIHSPLPWGQPRYLQRRQVPEKHGN